MALLRAQRPLWSGLYKEQIVTRSGKTIALPPSKLIDGSWGISTPIAVRDIAYVKLTHQPRGPTIKATLPIVER